MEVASSSSPRSNKRKSEDISVMDCEVQMEKKPKDVGGARVYKESANFEEDVHRTDELSVDEVRETNKCIADLLQPEETVLQALFRLKGSCSGKKEKIPEELKDKLNQLVENSMRLIYNGDNDVYNKKKEAFEDEAGCESLACVNFAADEKMARTYVVVRNATAVVVAAVGFEENKGLNERLCNKFKTVGPNIVCCSSSKITSTAIDNYSKDKKMITAQQKRLKVKGVAGSLADLVKKQIDYKHRKVGLQEICVAGTELDQKTRVISLSAWYSLDERVFEVSRHRAFGPRSYLADSLLIIWYRDEMTKDELVELAVKVVFRTSEFEKFTGDFIQVYEITREEGIVNSGKKWLQELVKSYDSYDGHLSLGKKPGYYQKGQITNRFNYWREERKQEERKKEEERERKQEGKENNSVN